MNEVVVEMRGISKTFPGVKALDNVDFELRKGEVMALLGENGAGKSTLMKVLSGIYTKDDGKIFLGGTEMTQYSQKIARENGVAIIHQELNMCGHLTVKDNIFLDREPTKYGILDNKKNEKRCRDYIKRSRRRH